MVLTISWFILLAKHTNGTISKPHLGIIQKAKTKRNSLLWKKQVKGVLSMLNRIFLLFIRLLTKVYKFQGTEFWKCSET